MTTKRWWLIILLGTLAWAIGLGVIQWLKFRVFGYNGLDLAIYHQTVWSLAHGHGFGLSIHDPSYLGDHVELWLIPVAAIYRLWQSPLTLLWVQTLVLASSVIPLVILSRRYLSQRLSGLVVILFLLHPLLINVALYEFHGLIFALPLLLWSIIVYEQRRFWAWITFMILLLAVREDITFVVAGWGIMAAIDKRKWTWWAPPILLGGIWFILCQRIIGVHNFIPGDKFIVFYRWLGDSYRQMVTFPFRHPLVFLQHIFGLKNWSVVLGLVASFGFLPLFRPRVLWPLIIACVNLLVVATEPLGFLHSHYSVPFIPFLIWATLVAVRDFQAKKIWPQWEQTVVQSVLSISILLSPIYSHVLFGQAELPWHLDHSTFSPASVLQSALSQIQPNDRVLGSVNVLPNLTNRSHVYSLNYVYLGHRQFSETPYRLPTPIDAAIIDWQELAHYQFLYPESGFRGQTGSQRIREILRTNSLQPVWWEDSVVVYRRAKNTAGILTDQDRGSGETEHHFGPITLRGMPLVSTAAQVQPDTSIGYFWRVDKKIKKPIFIQYQLSRDGKIVWHSTRLLGQGGYPAGEWQVGQYWRTLDKITWPKLPAGPYKLTADVVTFDGQYRLDQWRQFVPYFTKETRLGTIDLGLR